ncbi:pyroglutamyl-peptidase I [Spelaeicoccus albus]|uniref:Pyroglutamyl-peptidase I n=1 Tax=Spelaeicoccus albus TaxID=1280376 RepID=A0A7Z0D2I9_9MICO|nr:pyroglutamyl-peptidase I [Spelaeicoccus albus]NYI67693.1 pyroglutamyl-peptidase [Spelaeicoccus albus]
MTRKVPTVLLTGFEPFDGKSVNPSWQAVRMLTGRAEAGDSGRVGGDLVGGDLIGPELIGAELPCEFGTCGDVLADLIDDHRPDVVVCVGEAAGRAELSVERVAINIDDARIPDNAGRQPIDRPVIAGAPAAYFSTLPIKAAAAAVRAAGVPAGISQTAGTFACNHVFYRLMHLIATRNLRLRGGFVHVPSSPDMRAEDAARGLARVVRASLDASDDIVAVGGAEC